MTSTSNCTDYQARRLNARYKVKDKKGTHFTHTLNGTALALSRALISVLENHQQADGSVTIPQAIRGLGRQRRFGVLRSRFDGRLGDLARLENN